MKHDYPDIISKLGPPLWWDDNGTPRYEEFRPDLSPSVYVRSVALMEIACQACGTLFKVAISGSAWEDDLLILHKDHRLHYGDPPNANCCAAGPTMNSEPRKILEFWHRNLLKNEGWKRVPEYEGPYFGWVKPEKK